MPRHDEPENDGDTPLGVRVRRLEVDIVRLQTLNSDIAKSVGEIKESIRWAVKVVLGAVIAAILALVLKNGSENARSGQQSVSQSGPSAQASSSSSP